MQPLSQGETLSGSKDSICNQKAAKYQLHHLTAGCLKMILGRSFLELRGGDKLVTFPGASMVRLYYYTFKKIKVKRDGTKFGCNKKRAK